MLSRINRHRGMIGWSIAGVMVGMVIFTAINIYWYGYFSSVKQGDAAIVLGAEAWADKPSPVFRERINHAINLYKQRQIGAIIFTGGFGMGKKYAEADVAKNYAIASGVSPEDVFTETKSRTTFENLKYSQSIVQEQKFQQVVIISDPLHLKRAVAMARDLGINAFPAATPTTRYQSWQSQGQFLTREVYFYLVYLAFKV